MNAVSEFNAAASRWGGYMLDSLSGGLIAAGLAAVITLAFRRRLSAQAVSGLWLLVLVRVLLPFSVPVPVMAPVPVRMNTAGHAGVAAVAPAGETISETAVRGALPGNAGITAAGWCFALWLPVAGAGLVRLMWVARRTALVVRLSRPAEAGELPVDTDAVARAVGLKQAVPLRISGHVQSPAVAGLTSPVLLIPEGLRDQLSAAQWRWTIAHELLHVRRRDLWIQAAQAVTAVLFFFHPAVWLASRAINTRREEICDAGASSLTNTAPRDSAAGFLTILEWARGRRARPLAAAGMSSSHRRAKKRIGRLLNHRAEAQEGRMGGVLAAVAGAALILLPGMRPVRAAGSQAGAAGEAQMRIQALESRVAELEKELRSKTRLTLLREKAEAAARARAARDAAAYTSDQLHEMEQIYQTAKKLPSYDLIAAAMQPLLDRFPDSNRAGCAALYAGRGLEGEPRRQWLMHAAVHGHDCLFLDGTSAGGVARILLAADSAAAGDTAARDRFLAEVRAAYPDGIDFDGVPLTELANAIEGANR